MLVLEKLLLSFNNGRYSSPQRSKLFDRRFTSGALSINFRQLFICVGELSSSELDDDRRLVEFSRLLLIWLFENEQEKKSARKNKNIQYEMQFNSKLIVGLASETWANFKSFWINTMAYDIYFKFCDENKLVGRCRNGEFLDRVKKRFIGRSPLLLLLLTVFLNSLFIFTKNFHYRPFEYRNNKITWKSQSSLFANTIAHYHPHSELKFILLCTFSLNNLWSFPIWFWFKLLSIWDKPNLAKFQSFDELHSISTNKFPINMCA